MKKSLLLLGAFFTAAVFAACFAKPLFNGKNLDGWKVHGTELWYVDNGEMVCESGPDREYGYLATDKKYKNFVLTLEFMPIENGNSGVFVRSNLNGTDIKGWQSEVAPAFSGGIYESGGRGWIALPDEEKTKKLLKHGQWNTMKIRVEGDNIKTWLNGNPITDLTDETFGKGDGVIALQIHSVSPNDPIVKLRWRNIEIEELP